MASESGRRALAKRCQLIVVAAAVATLHTLLMYLLAGALQHSYSRLADTVIETDFIPNDRPAPKPPTFPPLLLQAGSPIEFSPLRLDIDVPTEQVAATQAIDARYSDASPRSVLANAAPYDVDPAPLLRPRPISGPRGVDRYPNGSIKAKESGTVVINICVSQAGRVDSVEVTRSSGFPRLDKVAVGIASEYLFQPATRQGRPVAACAEYYIAFKLT
jgi:periplasmic protein TonB